MGEALLAATSKSTSGSPFTLIIILALIFGVFYFVMIRPQRSRQRQVMQTQSTLVPGQRVRTTAGMYGTVTAVEDGDVVIEIAPGVEVRHLRRAIMDVLSDAPDGTQPGGSADGSNPGMDAAKYADEPSADEPGTAPGGHATE